MDPIPRVVNFNKFDPKKGNPRTEKLKRDLTKPSPGDYNIEEAFSKTQRVNIAFK